MESSLLKPACVGGAGLEMISPDIKHACPHVMVQDEHTHQLIGSQCRGCGEVYFPSCRNCTRCSGVEFEPYWLGSSGSLWSWTIQSFLPKSPYDSGESELDFKPYGVGYVEMPSGIKVESRLIVDEDRPFAIGARMELTLEPYRTDAHGQRWVTFAFKVAEGHSDEQ